MNLFSIARMVGIFFGALLACAANQAWALESASAAVNPSNPTGQIDVNWSDSYGGYCTDAYWCTYTIQRKTGIGGTWTTLTSLNIDGTSGSYADTTVASGITYYYRVSLEDACSCLGGSMYVDTAAVTTAGPPPAPSGLTATPASASQINLAWTNNGGTRLIVEHKAGSGGTWSITGILGVGVATYVDLGLQPNTVYYYRVKATSSDGDSAYAETNATTSALSAPGTPSGLTATAISSSQINLAWVNVSGETGYKIERMTGSGGTYSQVATVPADSTSYSDIGLTGGTTYYYQIRATNSGVDSAYSSAASATTSSGGTSSTVGKRTSAFEYDAATGLLTKEIIEPDNSNLCLVTTYAYDGYGNKTSATTRNCNGGSNEAAAPGGDAVFLSRTTSTGYDTAGRFATSATNALGQFETRAYSNDFGLVTSLIGPNSLTTSWSYDTFGRKTLETRADDTKTQWDYLFCSGVNGGTASCPTGAKYLVRVTPKNSGGSANGPVSTTYLDILGREIRSETQGFDGTAIYKDTEYDSQGRVYRSSNPYYTGGTPVWTTLQYDNLGRVVQQTAPNGGVLVSTYNGLTTVVTDVANHTETRIKNSQGQLIQVIRQ